MARLETEFMAARRGLEAQLRQAETAVSNLEATRRSEGAVQQVAVTYAPLIFIYPLHIAMLPPTRHCSDDDRQW